MPQINKIRIVNFNYNDGNRFIPDELYDLTSEKGDALNSLFNLNNGGGKTVLVQLMMQPVHPRAMAGGRRVEDYFSHPGDHSFVLIEWSLDGSDEKLLTGIAIAGSSNGSSDENIRGNTIRYYTFKTVYTNSYSPYSIASLELSKNVNGKYVAAPFSYIRDKAKSSRGMLEYYSSDDSIKWNRELSEYGVYKSEWQTVIEALNKDEGGLNQYFDDAKTSDKLISKFFIPAIENKMKSVALMGKDSTLETMLINYAKKISEKEAVIKERDINRRLIGELTSLGEMSDKLYSMGEELTDCVGEVCGFKASVGRKIDDIDNQKLTAIQNIQDIDSKIKHIEHEKISREFYDAEQDFKLTEKAFVEAKEALEEAQEYEKTKKHDVDILQSARLYGYIVDADSQITVYNKLIEDTEKNSKDAEAVARLKYSVFVKAKEENLLLSNAITETDNKLKQKKQELGDSEAEKERCEKTWNTAKENNAQISANLNVAKDNTDNRIKALKIEAARMLDGFYAEREIEAERRKKADSRDKIAASASMLQNEIKALEDRKSIIPGELANIRFEIDTLSRERKDIDKELAEYLKLLNSLETVCSKYSLEANTIFSGRLKNVIEKDIEVTGAKIRKQQQDKESLEERLKAARDGHVHILPDIMNYVISTGINCQTGEEYITSLLENGSVTHEKVDDILSKHPEFAFSLLFDNERDMGKLLSAGNVEWLSASVPLFTMEQVNALMYGNMAEASHLAVFDSFYFANKSGYLGRLEKEISIKTEQLQRFTERLNESKADKKLADQFEYTEDWYFLKENHIRELDENITHLGSRKKELEDELSSIRKKTDILKEDLALAEKHLLDLEKWLELFAELNNMLTKENDWYIKGQEAYVILKNTENEFRTSCEVCAKCMKELSALKNERREQEEYLAHVRLVLKNVDNAGETEIIEGALDELYSRYKTLCSNLSESLDNLRMNLEKTLGDKEEYEKELGDYKCEKSEYETVYFSREALKKAKEAEKKAEDKKEQAQLFYDDLNRKEATAKHRFGVAGKALEEYKGEVLPQNEIGDDFKARIEAARLEIRQLNEIKDALETEKHSLEKIFDRVEDVLISLSSVEKIKSVPLSDKPDIQYKSIYKNLIQAKKTFEAQKEKLKDGIYSIVTEFRDIALSEIVNKLVAIGDMLDDTGIKGDRIYTVSESINTMTASIEKINSKIETDLREIENDFNDIVDQCINQGKRMYHDLRMIAASSKTHIFEGKPQIQMVKMSLPEEKEISEESSRVSVKTEIEQGANEIKELLGNNADEKQIHKRARAIVSSERLLHKYIRQESIQIKVYKIDMNSVNSVYKRWEDTLTQNSGAEKFVVFFSVVLTLMNYNRSSAGLLNRNIRSVLILDNPFGKITSAHLLKPMFDIAKHFNVQLICLSDINKSDVVGCFDCVIKLVIKAQTLSNFEIMTHEGNEKIEHGYYKIINRQMSLF